MAGLTGPDVVIASEAKQSRLWWTRTGLLRRFSAKLLRNLSRAPRNDKLSHSRGACVRVLQSHVPRKTEGAGNAGRLARPQPRAQKKKAHELVTTGSPKTFRHSLRDGFNAFLRALPGDRAFLSPSSARCVSIAACLAPASRRQDHTTSPSACRRSSCGLQTSIASRAQRP